jgi:hypothetical protein
MKLNEKHKKSDEHKGTSKCPGPEMCTIRKSSGKVFGCKTRLAQPVGEEINGN